jgi:putative ABC transport system permease protein
MSVRPRDDLGERVRGERVYRLLLRAYPRRFRSRYAEDMVEFYRDRVRVARPHLGTLLRVWIQLLPDLLSTAVAEHFAPVHREVERAPRVVSTYSTRREDSMSLFLQDVRYALRSMLRRPGFTAVMLATIALGIGANAAIFTIVNAVLLRPLPFAHQERIVDFANVDPYWNVSEPEFVDYQRGVTSLASLAAYNANNVTISVGSDAPTRTVATRVSRDFFDILGVSPELGRTIASDEFSHLSKARPLVISHRLWVQQFAADPKVVGRTLTLRGAPWTIVGVMPAQFVFPDAQTTVWTPWQMNPDSLWTRNNHYLRMVGLIAPGQSIERARTQVRTLTQRWMRDFPETYSRTQPIVGVVTPLREFILGPTRPYLIALLGAVGFILLIACVNVANLLLVRGEGRRKEFAIRTALGASGGRIVRQMLTESMLIAIAGALLGVGLASIGVRALVQLAPSDLPRLDQVGVDMRVVGFTALITAVTGILFGLVPALRGRSSESADALRAGGKTSAAPVSNMARRALVIAEIALAVIMLAGAGLLIRSLIKLQQTSLGFDPQRLLTMDVTLPARKYSDTTADLFFQQLIDRTAHLPGVRSAALVGSLPISGDDSFWSIMIDGHIVKTTAEAPGAKPQFASPGFFETMGVKIVRGRAFTAQDRLGGQPVGIVSEGMARKLWPGVDPIGHTFRMFGGESPWITIVGVAADVRSRGLQQEIPETMYIPYSQTGTSAYTMQRTMTLIARTVGDPNGIAATVRNVVRSADASAALSKVAAMDAVIGDSIASRRFTTVLLAGFAALALTLAGIGIYGVISYGVSQRSYEIGVRMAMGASPAAVLKLVIREGADLTAIGLTIGLAGALLIDHLLQSLLVGVSPSDVLTLAAVTIALALVAAIACALPARRATRVSPTEALRAG